jgi:iron complex transport system ATP-binding protein
MVTLQLSHVEARYGRKIVYADASTPDITGGHLTGRIRPICVTCRRTRA